MKSASLAILFALFQGAGLEPATSTSPQQQQVQSAPELVTVLPQKEPCPPVNLLDSPQAIRAAGFELELLAVAAPPIEPCPGVFADCEDQPGRLCRETNCSTSDSGDKRCERPDGSVLKCMGNQSIHVTSCGCTAGPTLICCFDESCGFECGFCGSGSQTIFCQ